MKILHTADWHLGQVFYGYDRTEEENDMLRQIREIVAEEKPDAMVVSGDIFNNGSPSSAAQKMYNDAILDIHLACPEMTIVIISGNHDSGAKLTVTNSLWEHFQVHLLGSIERTPEGKSDFSKHIFDVKGTDGNIIGYIAAVPHTYPSNFPTAPDENKSKQEQYFHGLLEAVATKNESHLPVVLMAHLAVKGCDTTGHDLIGGMDYAEVTEMGTGYDYLALGHIHKPQAPSQSARYCGTPIPVNFGEQFDHSVSIVELEKGQAAAISTRAIHNLIPLLDIPAQPKPFAEVYKELQEYPSDVTAYIRVMIQPDETMTPLALEKITEAIKGKKLRYCRMQIAQHKSSPEHQRIRISLHDMKTKSPLEIAEIYFSQLAAKNDGSQFDEDMRGKLAEITKQIQEPNS